MKTARIQVENNDPTRAMQEILRSLLASDLVDALLAPRALPGANGFVQTLIRDPELLTETNPVAPTMAVQSARILSELTSKPGGGRIAAVLKPCELRAAVELTKFLQVDLENVVTVSFDCDGTYGVKEYAEGDRNQLRESCRICEEPIPTNADLAFRMFGVETGSEIELTVGDRFEEELERVLGLGAESRDGETDAGACAGGPRQGTEQVLATREEERSAVLAELAEKVNGLDKFMETLSTCIRCHNCMSACPICYCRECVFDSDVFRHQPEQFFTWAERRGGIRMPADTLMFHLTRMSHMATSCVGCGMCESACPSKLPISSLFSLVGGDLQEMFEYVPGRDSGEEPPVSVFKEDELQAESAAE